MKVKRFFAALSAAVFAAATMVSCFPDQELGDPSVTLSENTINFSAAEEDTVIELSSTLDWRLKGYSDDVKAWLSISPEEGTASKKPASIVVAVTANTGKDRTVTIEFYGDKLHTAALTINQAGSQAAGNGSLENPYSASEANALVMALASGEETPQAYYVHGFVKKFGSKHEDGINSFGNASFYFTDDASLSGDDFYAYQVYAPGNVKFTSVDQIKIGDEVIVYGKLTNYNGTPETVGKGAAYVYSINGKTEADTPTPSEAVNATVAEFNAAPVDASKYYRLSGTVGGSINTTYGNFDLTDATGTVYVYGLSNINEVKDKLLAGAKITIVGTRGDYNGKIEVLNGKCESIEGGQAPEPPANVTNATVAEFNAAPVDASKYYRLSGTVGGSINTTYGNFDLTDATGTVYVYGLSNIADVKDKLVSGATITVVGTRGDYNGKIEVLNGTCESIEAGDTPGPGPGPVDGGEFDSSIAWTLGTNAYDQAATINGQSVAHVLKLGKSATAGSATLKVPAGTESIQFYAYAWKAKTVKLSISMGGSTQDVSLKANDGCTGNPPYVITADAADIITLNFTSALSADTDITLATDVERAVLFGIKPATGGDSGAENYTIDMINAVDCYVYEYGDGRYVWDLDLYVTDIEKNTYSKNLDVYIPLILDGKTKMNGTHAFEIDPDYYEYYGYTTNEGVYSAFTEGTITIKCIEAYNSYYEAPVYSFDITSKLQNGNDFNYKFEVRAIAVDVDSENWDEITLEDEVATKAVRRHVSRGKKAGNKSFRIR